MRASKFRSMFASGEFQLTICENASLKKLKGSQNPSNRLKEGPSIKEVGLANNRVKVSKEPELEL